MTEPNTDLPLEWSVVPPAEQQESVLVEYRYQPDGETTFLVSVLSPASRGPLYELRLSTITQQPQALRHDYPVAHYETREKAHENAIAFINYLTTKFEQGTLSRTDPEIDAIRSVISGFSSNGLFPMFRFLSSRIPRK